MTTHFNTTLFGLCLIFLLSGCRAFYQASPAPTPILKEKGDGNIFISPTDVQLAYAITPFLGLTASGHLDKKGNSIFSDTSGFFSKLLDRQFEDLESKGYTSLQGGAIFLHKLDHTKSIQAGIVAGTYQPSMMINVNRGFLKKNTDELLTYKCIKADFFVNYLHTSKYFDFITTVKLVGTQYNEAIYSEPLVQKELSKMQVFEYPNLKNRYYFVEPSATIQYGFDHFKFHAQIFYSQPLQENIFAKDQFGISWGLNYQFNIKKQVAQRRRPRV